MSDLDITSELAVAAPPAGPVGPPPDNPGSLEERRIDEVFAALAIPLPERPPLIDRVVGLASQLLATPLRAALATLWAVAAIVMAITWLLQAQLAVGTSLGPARVSCGIDIFVYGYPEHAVDQACRHAEATRFGLFVPAAVIVVAGLVLAGLLAYRSSAPESGPRRFVLRLWRSRVQAILAALGALAAVVGIFALRPVPVDLVRSGVLVNARCGADTYFGGYPDPFVHAACLHAYAPQAHVLEVACALIVVGLGAVLQVAFTHTPSPFHKRRLWVGVVTGALAVVALVALRPVTVTVTGGPAPVVANCGIDSFLAGYPDRAVQTACRSRFANHATVGLASGSLAILVCAGSAVTAARRRPEPSAARTGIEG
jgi:hypothetical protein